MIIYCQKLLKNLKLSKNIQNYRQVFLVYPTYSLGKSLIWRSVTAKLQTPENQTDEIWRMPSAKLEEWETSPTKLFNRLNFSSLLYFTSLEDPLKRAFYE